MTVVWLAFVVAGCAADLARASAPAIGCAPAEVEIDDVSVGWSETSWSARCRGVQFHCSGERGATCGPDRDATASSEPTPTAQ